MANTYSQIYIHVVFTVKNRQSLIQENNREELQKFISGIVGNRNQKLLAIYCMPDHVHILLSLSPNILISDLVRDIKAGSSKFINEKHWVTGKFSWQEGFGAFSCSQSQVEKVINYILNQPVRHKKQNFKTEYLSMLKKHAVDFNEKYLFNWI